MIRMSLIACFACAVAVFACTHAHAAAPLTRPPVVAGELVDLNAWSKIIETVHEQTNVLHDYVACGSDGRPCFDCVDFAIAKMQALEEVGIPPSAIRFVELVDKGGVRHAAAAVFGWDSHTGFVTALVLDHTMSRVEPLAAYEQAITGIIMIHGGAE